MRPLRPFAAVLVVLFFLLPFSTPTHAQTLLANTQASAAPRTAQSAADGETVSVPFVNGESGATTFNEYSGPVTLVVTGVGQAAGTRMSDAFYLYTDEQGNPTPPEHSSSGYNFTLFINDQPADALIQGAIPAYRSDHIYQFTINAPGGVLTFGVGDTNTGDNTGAYTIIVKSVASAVNTDGSYPGYPCLTARTTGYSDSGSGKPITSADYKGPPIGLFDPSTALPLTLSCYGYPTRPTDPVLLQQWKTVIGIVRCYTAAGSVIANDGPTWKNSNNLPPTHEYTPYRCHGGKLSVPTVKVVPATPILHNQTNTPNLYAGYAIYPTNETRYTETVGEWIIPQGYSTPIAKELTQWVSVGGLHFDKGNNDAIHQNGITPYVLCSPDGSAQPVCQRPDAPNNFYFFDQVTSIEHPYGFCRTGVCPETILTGPQPEMGNTIVAYTQERPNAAHPEQSTIVYGWINETSGELTTIKLPDPQSAPSKDAAAVIEDATGSGCIQQSDKTTVCKDWHQSSYPRVTFGPVLWAVTEHGKDVAFASSTLFKYVMGGSTTPVVIPTIPGLGASFTTEDTTPFIVLSKAKTHVGDHIDNLTVSGYYFDPTTFPTDYTGYVYLYRTQDVGTTGVPLGEVSLQSGGIFSVPRQISTEFGQAKGYIEASYNYPNPNPVVAYASLTALGLGSPHVAATAAINPEIGGVLTGDADGEQLSVNVPGNAIASITLLTATVPAAAAAAPTGSVLEGDAFDLTATDDVGTAVTTFAAPLTITFSYSSTISDADASRLQIEYYDTSTNSWTPLPGPDTLDTTQHTVSAQTDHFTLYGLFLTPNGQCVNPSCTPPPAATPELGSGKLLTTGLLPLGLALALRQLKRRRKMGDKDDGSPLDEVGNGNNTDSQL